MTHYVSTVSINALKTPVSFTCVWFSIKQTMSESVSYDTLKWLSVAKAACGGMKTVWRHLSYHQIRRRRELEEVVKVLTFCCKEKRWEACFIGKGNRFQSTGDSRKMDLCWVKTTITTGNKSSSALDRAIWRGLLQKDSKPALLGPS